MMDLRCKHLMIPEYCAICQGVVTASNQTRQYGAMGGYRFLFPVTIIKKKTLPTFKPRLKSDLKTKERIDFGTDEEREKRRQAALSNIHFNVRTTQRYTHPRPEDLEKWGRG